MASADLIVFFCNHWQHPQRAWDGTSAKKNHTTWHEFLKSHWDVLAAIDFTMIEVWTKNGLATFHLLFVMTQATRKVWFAGCTTNPN
jgi:hypothetical protein